MLVKNHNGKGTAGLINHQNYYKNQSSITFQVRLRQSGQANRVNDQGFNIAAALRRGYESHGALERV